MAKDDDVHVPRSDREIRTFKEDAFGFKDFAQALAEDLAQTDPPFTLGVFGRWGSGKTSLMRLLKRVLEESGPQHQTFLPIWFDAWKYDREDAIWRALLIHTLGAIEDWIKKPSEEHGPPEELKDRLESWRNEYAEPIQESLYRPFERTTQGDVQIDWQQLATGGLELAVPVITSSIPGATLLLDALRLRKKGKDDKAVQEDEQHVEGLRNVFKAFQREQRREYFAQIRFLDQFQQRFGQAVQQLVDIGAVDRLVFFIDDLDRCLPVKAIEVLEAIKLFLSNDWCLFVIGVDEEVIHAGVESRYGEAYRGFESGGRLFKQEYLEKIVQLPFPLPPLESERVHKYVDAQLRLDDNREMVVELLTIGGEYNPRKIKRLCWATDHVWKVASHRMGQAKGSEAQVRSFRPECVAKLVVIHQRDSQLYRAIVARPIELLIGLEGYWRSVDEYERHPPISAKSAEKESSESTAEKGPPEPRSEIKPYVQPNYDWLKRLLTWQPDQVDSKCWSFSDLGHYTLNHVQLATVSGGEHEARSAIPAKEQDIQSIKEALLSADPQVVASVAGKLKKEERFLYETWLNNEARSQDWRRRATALLALSRLGHQRPGTGLTADGLPDIAWVRIAGTADVTFPAGRQGFQMGLGMGPDEMADENETWPDANKFITVSEFHLAAYPVTVAQFRPFVEGDGYLNADYWTEAGWEWRQGEKITAPSYWANLYFNADSQPVVGVSWVEAVAYCRWLTAQLKTQDRPIRLPTEVEWEWAARGPEGKRYPWEREPSGDRPEWREGFCNANGSFQTTTAVGAFPDGGMDYWRAQKTGERSFSILHDLSGNVWEFCSNPWQKNYPFALPDSPWTSEDFLEGDARRMVRGGDWSARPEYVRSASRGWYLPATRLNYLGFRLAQDID